MVLGVWRLWPGSRRQAGEYRSAAAIIVMRRHRQRLRLRHRHEPHAKAVPNMICSNREYSSRRSSTVVVVVVVTQEVPMPMPVEDNGMSRGPFTAHGRCCSSTPKLLRAPSTPLPSTAIQVEGGEEWELAIERQRRSQRGGSSELEPPMRGCHPSTVLDAIVMGNITGLAIGSRICIGWSPPGPV